LGAKRGDLGAVILLTLIAALDKFNLPAILYGGISIRPTRSCFIAERKSVPLQRNPRIRRRQPATPGGEEVLRGARRNRCAFLARLPYEELLNTMPEWDIAAFPYPHTPMHRTKCSVRGVDYVSIGKAVVTAAIGQNIEYIVDRQSGILVPPQDET
jgi:hypothetical protein